MGKQLLVGWEEWKPSEWHTWSGHGCLSVYPLPPQGWETLTTPTAKGFPVSIWVAAGRLQPAAPCSR